MNENKTYQLVILYNLLTYCAIKHYGGHSKMVDIFNILSF